MMQKLNDNNVPPITHDMQLSGHLKFVECSITALCQKSRRKICRWFWATIHPHQARRILLKLRKQWQLRNLHSWTVQLFPSLGVFSGAVFNGEHFNITINTLNRSPNTSKCSVSTVARSCKRIRRVLDSSDENSPLAVPFRWQFLSTLFYW